jgi:hypothetical protein
LNHSGFFEKNRALAGIAIIALSYILGWPAVGVLAFIAYRLGDPMIAVIGGSAIYAFSWLVLLAGIWLVGREAYEKFKAGGLKGIWLKIFKAGPHDGTG